MTAYSYHGRRCHTASASVPMNYYHGYFESNREILSLKYEQRFSDKKMKLNEKFKVTSAIITLKTMENHAFLLFYS